MIATLREALKDSSYTIVARALRSLPELAGEAKPSLRTSGPPSHGDLLPQRL
jgi:hypothetical protein